MISPMTFLFHELARQLRKAHLTLPPHESEKSGNGQNEGLICRASDPQALFPILQTFPNTELPIPKEIYG
jgi:hypothetical protein